MKCFFHDIAKIPVDKVIPEAELTLPRDAESIVIFSHAGSCSRISRCCQKIPQDLQQHGDGATNRFNHYLKVQHHQPL